MPAVIQGSTTRLREPREGDLAVLGAMRNDLDLQGLLLARGRPNSATRVREWVERTSGREDAVFFVVADLDDAPLGFAQVTGLDLVDGHGHLGIALAASSRGGGHGTEAIELLCGYLRRVFGLHKLVLEVAASNGEALASYAKAGFREVGVLQGHVRQGDDRVDVVIMERLLAP